MSLGTLPGVPLRDLRSRLGVLSFKPLVLVLSLARPCVVGALPLEMLFGVRPRLGVEELGEDFLAGAFGAGVFRGVDLFLSSTCSDSSLVKLDKS